MSEDLFFTNIPLHRDKIDDEDSMRVRKAVQELIDLLSHDSLLFMGGGVIFLPLNRFEIGGWTFRSNNKSDKWGTGDVCVYMVEEKPFEFLMEGNTLMDLPEGIGY